MRLRKTAEGTVVEVYVKPNSEQFQLKTEGDELVVFCRGAPVKGRANRELMKELSRLFKRRVEILSGLSSRRKKVLIRNVSTEEVYGILSAYADAQEKI